MFPLIEYIKTCLNGILLRITNLAKEIDKKIDKNISDAMAASKADWNQNDPDALNYVKNRPMYPYQENIGKEYIISDISSNPFPLVFGEEWYVMGTLSGEKDRYLPEGTKTIFTVGKNSSGDLCIASDLSYGFSTGSEASSGNRFIIYSDHVYQNASWQQFMAAGAISAFRLAEPSYKIAYKTIDANLLPMACDETPGIVHPYTNSERRGTAVEVTGDGRLYCDTELTVVNVPKDFNISLSFQGLLYKTFLMFFPAKSSTDHIRINGSSYAVYVNGVLKGIPASSNKQLFLALADSSTKKLHLVINSIT